MPSQCVEKLPLEQASTGWRIRSFAELALTNPYEMRKALEAQDGAPRSVNRLSVK